MKIRTISYLSDHYESPSIIVYSVLNEGVLCTSAVHDSLIEDNEWEELLD